MNKFYKNIARISGGAIMLDDKIPINLESANSYSGNYAKYFGPDFASNPFRIIFLINENFCKKIFKL